MSGRRPLGATELIALGVGVGYVGQTFVQGFFAVLGGLALIVERNNNDLIAQVDQTSGRITTYAVAAILWGVIAFIMALGL
jgi:hypothetical protein